MNSDPTCYFTLYGMTAAIQVENTLRDMYNSVLTGGFMSFIDTLAGEETDPYKLLQAFGNGAMEELKSSAITASLTAVRNLGCLAPKLAMLSSLALVGLSGKSTFDALQGAVDSLLEGNYKQALFRALGFGLSAYGTYKASAAAFDTMTGVINGTACFVAGTTVLTEDGEKPIEDIEIGDYVYASDPETGENGYKEVLQTFINETTELIHIHVNGDEIISTPTHPFYSPQRGWTSAVDLKAGDILVLSNGDYVVVEQVQHEILESPIKVYNFEVQDFHTYYVSKNSVLVHNMCEIGNTDIESKPRENTNLKGNNSRINIAKGPTRFTPLRKSGSPMSAGWEHVLEQHFGRELAPNRFVFSISENKLIDILGRKDIIQTPITATKEGVFVRIVDTGMVVGKTSLNYGGVDTTYIKIFTDSKGNLINTFPVPRP